jgi:2-oxo-4-hydroxy-4-carboxy-5-ureidoimidazoline decarboxylase
MFQLDYLNTCTAETFEAALGEIFEHSPWVAQGAVAKRPFPTVTGLHDAMMAVVRVTPATAFEGEDRAR